MTDHDQDDERELGRAEREELRVRLHPRDMQSGERFLHLQARRLLLSIFATATAVMSRAFDGLLGLGVLAAIYCLRSTVSLTLWALAGAALARRFGGSGPAVERVLGASLIVLALLLFAGQL